MRQLDNGPIPSPFTAGWQAPAFGVLLVALLALPVLAQVLQLDTARNRYLEMETYYRNAHTLTYEQTDDLDVLFLGTCFFQSGLDIPVFQEAFSKRWGRPARVGMLATKFSGEDFEYVMLRDLLQQRKVKMLVTGMPGARTSPDTPHVMAPYWLRFADVVELGAGQTPVTQGQLYALAVLSAPRHFLGNLRPETLGHPVENWGMEETRFCLDHTDFVPLAPSAEKLAQTDWTYREAANGDRFLFNGQGIPRYRRSAFEKIVELARRHQVVMANLHMTTRHDTQSKQVVDDANWQKFFDYPIAQIGVPPADYFRGLDEKTIDCLFWDAHHPNKNGATYFSKIVAPSLLRIYAEQVENRR